MLDLNVFGHPVDGKEPSPREDLAAMNELLREVSLSEFKEALGWVADTYWFTSLLLEKKYNDWTNQTLSIIKFSVKRERP